MLALTEAAALYRCAGIADGRPVYAADAEAFACRTQPEAACAASGRGLVRGRTVRLYAEPTEVRPGDRIVLGDGGALIVESVKAHRGRRGIHHMEIEAVSEGAT